MTSGSATTMATPRAASARPAAPAGPAVAIDPVRLARQNIVPLAASVLVGALLGVGAYFALGALMPRYTAEAVFEGEMYTRPDDVSNTVTDDRSMLNFIGGQLNLIDGRGFATMVAREPRLRQAAPALVEEASADGAFDEDEASKLLNEAIFSEAVPRSYQFKLRVTRPSAQEAASIANLAQEVYIDGRGRTSSTEVRDRIDDVNREIERGIENLGRLTQQRDRLISQNSLQSLTEASSETNAHLQQINIELIRLNARLEQARTMQKGLEDARRGSEIQFTDGQIERAKQDVRVVDLDRQINGLEANLGSLRENFAETHYQVQQLVRQIDGTRRQREQVRNEVLLELYNADAELMRQQVQSMETQRADLETERDELRAEARRVAQILQEIEDIEREIAQTRELNTRLNTTLQNLQLASTADSVRQVSLAVPVLEPNRRSWPPSLPVMVFLGAAFCGGLMGGLVVLREIADTRVKGASDVRLAARVPVLGVVTEAALSDEKVPAVATAYRDRPKGMLAEQVRQVRTPLLKRMDARGHKVVLMMPITPGAGATAMSMNLAYAAAASDRRVLLIDANFRRPEVGKTLGLGGAAGLGDVLGGTASLAEAVHAADDRLDVLPAGTDGATVVERLGSAAMSDLLDQARERYDLIILDTSPAMVSSDGMSLAQRADAVALVVRALRAKRGMVSRVVSELEESGGEVLGVIVNGVRPSAGGYLRENLRTAASYNA